MYGCSFVINDIYKVSDVGLHLHDSCALATELQYSVDSHKQKVQISCDRLICFYRFVAPISPVTTKELILS